MKEPLDLIAEHIRKEEAKRKLQATFPTIVSAEMHEGPNRAQRRQMKKKGNN